MRAIVLAAGRGSRMGEQTRLRPKCLTQFAGQALLDWQLQALRGAGIREIAVVRGYLAELVARPSLSYFENTRWADTNMVASLTCAAPWLEASECVVSYSDIIYPADHVRVLGGASGDIVVAYDTKWLELWSRRFADPLSDAETFRIDAHGTLTEIGNRPKTLEEIEGQYLGLLKFTPAGWRQVLDLNAALPPARRDRIDMTGMLKELIAHGAKIRTVPVAGAWYEIDSESDLKLYTEWVRKNDGAIWAR
jgi:choline kinase